MAVSIDEVIRHLVEEAHWGSDANREEALEAVDKEYGTKDEPAKPDDPCDDPDEPVKE